MMNIEERMLGGLCLLILTTVVFCAIDQIINEPYAAQNAQEECITRGFDNYDSFERPRFSREAYGVRCKYENKYMLTEGGILVDSKGN